MQPDIMRYMDIVIRYFLDDIVLNQRMGLQMTTSVDIAWFYLMSF